ncbi:MAG: MarR family transcriptional regulator [Richelia sp. RM2_1_2]|nr:MarR family transcriptional regulator [Richelia sp. RM2_1_2]
MTKNNCYVQNESNSAEHKQKTPLFYRLTHDEWVETVKNLTGAEIKVLYYLRSLDPFGDRHLEYSITEMAKELTLSKGAASKAVKKLDQIGLIDAQILKVKIKITTDRYKETKFPIRNNVSYSESRFPIGNPNFVEETSVSYRKPQIPIGNKRQSEPLPEGHLTTPQTIKTYSDFIKTLSEKERASFFNFCQQKTKNLSQEVIDLEAWLASKTKAGENRWEVQYRFYQASTLCRNQEQHTQAREQVEKWKRDLEKQTITATVTCKNR